MGSVVALLLPPGIAAADPGGFPIPLGDLREMSHREGGFEPQQDIDVADLDATWRLDASALALTAAQRDDTALRGTISAGGEVAISHAECDLVVAGGQLDVSAGVGAPLSAQQWASLCPVAGALDMTIDHRVEWDVTPSLLAAPRLRPDRNRRETIEIAVTGKMRLNDPGPLSIAPPPPEHLIFFGVAMGFSVGWAADDSANGDVSVGGRMSWVGFRRERDGASATLELWIIGATFEMVTPTAVPLTPEEDIGATMIRADGFQLSGAHLGGFEVAARAGLQMVSLYQGAGTGDDYQLTDLMAPTGALQLERALAADGALRVAAERRAWAAWDGRAVIDDRVTIGLARTVGRMRLRSEVFGASTYLFDTMGAISHGGTGGLTAIAETDLGDHALFRVRSDVGRGFYADGASFDQPRWAGEVLATVSVHAGTR